MFPDLGRAETPDALRQPVHVEVPLKLYEGYLVVVEGRIGPLTGLKFVLDTGATYSVASREVADKLHLTRRPGKVIGVGKTVATEWAVVPSLEFGAVHAPNMAVMVDDLGYFQPISTHVDAVIGLDLLGSQSFSIDFRRKTVTFGPIADGPSGVTMKSDARYLTVELLIEDRPARVIVDTGVRGLLLYEERLLRHMLKVQYGPELIGFSLGGALPSKLAMLPGIRLGTTNIDRKVLLTPAPADKVLPGIDGFFGVSSLEARRIDFDFEHGTLRWTK